MSCSCERLVFLGFNDVINDIVKCDFSRVAFASKISMIIPDLCLRTEGPGGELPAN